MPDDVTEPEKTRRFVELQALQRDIQTGMHEASVGRLVEVLVDSVSRRHDGELSGRTFGNTVVNFAQPADTPQHDRTAADGTSWIGRIVSVRILRAGPHSLRGELTSRAQA